MLSSFAMISVPVSFMLVSCFLGKDMKIFISNICKDGDGEWRRWAAGVEPINGS